MACHCLFLRPDLGIITNRSRTDLEWITNRTSLHRNYALPTWKTKAFGTIIRSRYLGLIDQFFVVAQVLNLMVFKLETTTKYECRYATSS